MENNTLFTHKCLYCKQEFAGKRSHAQYCSDKCRGQAFREQRGKQNTDNSMQIPGEVKTIKSPFDKPLALPSGLAPDAAFIVAELTRQRDKLDTKVSEYEKRIETLQNEKNALEKDLDKATAEINAKPSALAGLFSDPDKLSNIVQAVPGILSGISEMIRAGKESNTAIAGPNQEQNQQAPQQQHPVIAWYNAQNEEVRKAFNGMIEYFAALNGNQVIDVISYTNRNAMAYKNRAQ